MKVSQKITLAMMTGVLFIHGLSASFWILRERAELLEDIARDERRLGHALSQAVAEIWRLSGEEAALARVEQTNETRDEMEIRWVWLDAAAGDRHAPVSPRAALGPVVRGEFVVVHRPADAEAVYTYAPVHTPGSRVGAIEISDFLTDENSQLRQSVLAALLTAALLVSLSTLLAWMLGRVFVGRPVEQLVNHARRVGGGDLTERLIAPSRDEFGQLTRAFNQMCNDLGQAHDRADREMNARLATLEQLRHADRLATVGTLASGVAHELGTPINVIEGHAQLIQEDSGASERCRENAEVITRQSKRMAHIIRDLLRFARRGASCGDSADVAEVARETLRLLEPLRHKRALDISVVSEGEAIARIGRDPLQQVFTNLFLNAVQATADGGTVAIRVSRARRPLTAEGQELADYACVRVQDTGSGMDAETKMRIFEPFFTTKDVGEGTGLGLSVAFGIVQDHGGFIDVASEPGGGSTFSIYLRLEQST